MGTNNILVFCPDGTESAGDVLSLTAYRTDAHRQRGHQPGIARRELENKALRQATWMASAVAQFIANTTAHNVEDSGAVADVAKALAEASAGKDFSVDIAALWAAIQALQAGGDSGGGSGGGDTPAGGPYMPLATTTAGKGQLVYLAANHGAPGYASCTLPGGGTWVYWYAWISSSGGDFTMGVQKTGIASGGTTLYSGNQVLFWGFAWRIV